MRRDRKEALFDRSQRHHECRVDAESSARFRVGQPGKLHDRSASGRQDPPLDIGSFALDDVPAAATDGYLGYRCHLS